MPKAILHLLDTAQPEGSGIARIVASLAGGLDPRKYHVHAWFLGPPGPLVEELRDAGATARSIDWWQGARNPVGAFRFWRCLRNHDFAIVHLHQHYGSRSVRRLLSLSSHARVVVHLHGRISEANSGHGVPLAVRGSDTVLAVSRAVALQLPSLKPNVVYAGVESSIFHPEIKSPRTATIIGAASRLVPLKGLIQLIQAVASLRSEFPNLQLEIAGEGPQREDLVKEASRLSLASQVRFLGWQQDLRPIFQNWDIFALPSVDEGFGMAALEAMAVGLPVVATSVGGLPELVEDCQTGYLVPPSDVVALAESLRLLIQDSKLRQSMGAAGRNRVLKHFSVDRMVAQMEAIYDSLLL